MSGFKFLTEDSILPGGLAVEDGVMIRLTECCRASAKGASYGVICRSCHHEIPPEYAIIWLATDDKKWEFYRDQLIARGMSRDEADAKVETVRTAALG